MFKKSFFTIYPIWLQLIFCGNSGKKEKKIERQISCSWLVFFSGWPEIFFSRSFFKRKVSKDTGQELVTVIDLFSSHTFRSRNKVLQMVSQKYWQELRVMGSMDWLVHFKGWQLIFLCRTFL